MGHIQDMLMDDTIDRSIQFEMHVLACSMVLFNGRWAIDISNRFRLHVCATTSFSLIGMAQRVRERAGRGSGLVHASACEPYVAYQASVALASRRRAAAVPQGASSLFGVKY